MDIQTGLVCVTVAIISAVVIYVISMPTMKEKTYDEMLADVRKRTEKQLSQGRSAKDKIKDKKDKKKAGKKVKEKSTSSGNDGFELSDVDGSNKNHVVFVEPEAAVLSENIVVEEKRRSKKKEKPILLNKNEPKAVAEKPVPIQNHFEQIHPKDDFELKRSHSREEMIKTSSTNTETATPAVIPVKEQNTQKHNKQSSKSTGGSNAANKAVVEQKVEKQQTSQVKQNQPKQLKQSEKINPVKTEKIANSNNNKAVINNQVVPPVVNSAGSDVKEVIVTKQTFSKPQAVPTKQGIVTPENNSPTPPISQQHSQNNEKPAASPTVKISKKKKSELAALNQISGGSDGVNVNLLMPLVRKAELSKSEIQLLIDFLLNKQQGISDSSSEWIEGRQDPVVKLKKQLAEKEKALADELEASVGFQARLKEIRAELNAEKHTVRTLEEAIHARQTEISSFALKLQHAVDEKQALAQQIQQLQTKLGEEHHLVRKLQEEGAQTQNAYQELLAQRQQLDMHIQHLNDTQHQQQETIATLEAQLTSQVQERDALASEFSLLQERTTLLQDNAIQVQELARQVEESRSVRGNLEHLVTSANFENGRLQTEVNELSEQLSIVRAENEKVNAALLSVQNENSRLREANERLNIQVSSACVEARQLRDENESLAAQVTASMERPATEGRENGDANNYSENKLSHIEDQDNIQKKELLLEDMSNQLKSKEILVENLTSELSSYKTEVVEQQRVVQSLKEEVNKHQQEAERLTNDLTQQKTQISRLLEQLDSQQSKNNDLRTKNWKVMEALSSTEKLLQSKMNESDKLVNEAVKSAVEKVLLEQQSSTRQLLQRVFPEIVVPECKGHQEWFEQVEKALRNWKPQQTDNNQSSCFAELEKQNNQLQAMVNHYKNIINDTEAMLNKLQKHVEQEESKWGEELQALKSQLEAVTLERDALQASSGSIQRATNGFNHVDDGCGND